jgi:hypothetical protein
MVGQARQFNDAIAAAFEGWSDEEVFGQVEVQKAQTQRDAALPPKQAEFDVFASGKAVIGDNSSEAKLFAETLSRDSWDPHRSPQSAGIRALVTVHRLREVSCLYGFTRFEAAPTTTDDEVEDVQLAVDGAPLGVDTDWLPAVEQFGEGLFIHFDQAGIASWLGRPDVHNRAAELEAGQIRWAELRGGKTKAERSLVYVMLHSLSHALMAEIALICGYPASSLKERIYALDHPGRPGHVTRSGILIYTATSGTQGTLGGLVATAPDFPNILQRALERLEVCSNDPVCADHEPASSADDRALHGAACHGCLLIAETSCETRNQYLDRSLLIETMGGNGAAFFG